MNVIKLESRPGLGRRKGQGQGQGDRLQEGDKPVERLWAWCAFVPRSLQILALNKRWPRHGQTHSTRCYPVPERGRLRKGVRRYKPLLKGDDFRDGDPYERRKYLRMIHVRKEKASIALISEQPCEKALSAEEKNCSNKNKSQV